MKKYNNILLLVALYATNFTCIAKVVRGAQQQIQKLPQQEPPRQQELQSTIPITQTIQQPSRRSTARTTRQPSRRSTTRTTRQAQRSITPTPQVQVQEPITQPNSYAYALNRIKTMQSDTVLQNNDFTQEFLDFIKSFNLSDVENTALLQAGVTRHAVWTANNEINKQIALTFENNIELAAQNIKPTLITPFRKPEVSEKPLKTSEKPPIKTTSYSFSSPIEEPETSEKPSEISIKPPIETTSYNLPSPIEEPETSEKPSEISIKPPVKIQPSPIQFPTPSKKPEISIKFPIKTTPSYPYTLPAPIEEYCIVNSVIINLDPDENETIATNNRAFTTNILLALQEQVAPIIMSSNLLKIIVNLRQKIGHDNLQKLRTLITTSIDQSALDTFAENLLKASNSEEDITSLLFLSLINFDNKNLNCYFHNSANLVLIIPQQYIKTNVPNYQNLNLQHQAQACGFNPTVMTVIQNWTVDNLMQQLKFQQSKSINEEEFVIALTSLFIPQEERSQWAIYLGGHGGPSKTFIGDIRKELEKSKEDLSWWQNNLTRLDLTEEDINLSQKYINQHQASINKYEKILQNKSNWQLVSESAYIAGLNLPNFSYLMDFFNKNIKVAFLYYSTCFAGGYNQTFVNEMLSSLNVNFIVASEGLDERGIVGIIPELIPNATKSHLVMNKQPYTDFFMLLKLFISKPEEFIKIKGKGKEPIAKILRTITPDMKKENQPFIRFPGAGVFAALSLEKTTKILTQSLVKAHEIEKTPIDVSNTNIGAIIVYPSRINVSLNLNKNSNCAIVSPSPKQTIPNYEALHIFKEVNFEDTLQSLLFDFIYLNARLYTQTFIIKSLIGILYQESKLPISLKQDKIIHNLIIQIKGIRGTSNTKNLRRAKLNLIMAELEKTPSSTFEQELIQNTPLTPDDIKEGEIGITAHICFELDGTIYQGILGIKDFTEVFIKPIIKKTTFTSQSAQTINMNTVASQFLTTEEIVKLPKPINLESIVKFFDSKIDIQQPFLSESSEETQKTLPEVLKEQQLRQQHQ